MVYIFSGPEVNRLEQLFIPDQNKCNKICLSNKMYSASYGHTNPKHAAKLPLGTAFSR